MGNPVKAVEVSSRDVVEKTPEFAKEWVRELGEFKPVDETQSLDPTPDTAVRLADTPMPERGSGPRQPMSDVFRPLKTILASLAPPAPKLEIKTVREALVRLQVAVSARGGETASRFLSSVAQAIDRVDVAAQQRPQFAAKEGIRKALETSVKWIEDYSVRLKDGKSTFFDSILLVHHLAIVNMSL